MKNFEVSPTQPKEAKPLTKYDYETYKDFHYTSIDAGSFIPTIHRLGIAKKFIDFMSDYPRRRAILIKPHEKIPAEPEWQKKNNYKINDNKVLNYIKAGGNHANIDPSGMSVDIDEDTEEIRNAVLSLGDTTEWNTGTPGHYCAFLLLKDKPIGNIPLRDGGYIRGRGGQNLSPGSTHPNGKTYGGAYLHLVPPLSVTKLELLEKLKPFIVGNENLFKNKLTEYRKPINPDSLAMRDLVNVSGFKQSGTKYRGSHPLHGSTTGTNFVIDFQENTWHCFRHGSGGGPIQWIAVSAGIIHCAESVPGKIRGELFWRVIAEAHNTYGLSYPELAGIFWGDHHSKQ